VARFEETPLDGVVGDFGDEPLPVVVRFSVRSWQTTSTLSEVSARSISTMSAPMPITDSMAAREFSGQLRQSPRWQATSTFFEAGL